MSLIVTYKFEQVKTFMQEIEKQYEKNLTQGLPFEEWKCMAYPNMFEHPEDFRIIPWKLGVPINVAPSAVEMLKIIKEHEKEAQEIELNEPPEKQDYLKTQLYKRILKPTHSFTINDPITIPGELDGKQIDVPIWFNSTMKSVNVRLGFDKLDSSKPGAIPLSDLPVHMLLGGITGSGKSVALNDIICSLLLEYPPWELSLILADFKIAELSRYANRIPTPHVKIVAATGSIEFALSTFQYIIDEMNARLEVFTAVGVQNIKDFREKFNLCMPRMLLVADEFVQMYENVKDAEAKGNDKAEELKKAINSAISAIARLGRSQGIHMLLSSQNMDGVLDEQTAGQFGAGATLAATASVSKTLIGNAAGSTIRGKGKAYVNLNKNEKNIQDNILVRVPFINAELSEEDANAGKLSYLQELLKQLYDKAQSLGWDNTPYYYNENAAIPRNLFYQSLLEGIEYLQNPNEGSDISNQLYMKQTFARLPLGREIAYTKDNSYYISLQYKQMNNLLIHADDPIMKIYMIKLIGEALSYYADQYVVLSIDEAIRQTAAVESFAEAQHIKVELNSTGEFPATYFSLVASRQMYLDLQNLFTTKSGGAWDDQLAFEFAYNHLPDKQKPALSAVMKSFSGKFSDLEQLKDKDEAFALFTEPSQLGEDFIFSLIQKYNILRKTFNRLTKNRTKVIEPRTFEKIVIWWMGAEQLKNVTDYDYRKDLVAFLKSSCQVGIFNIVVPSLKCGSLGEIPIACNYVLENCSKEFFMDVELPKYININKNSYGAHDRELKTNKFLRVYS